MSEWFHDPKSLALIASAATSIVISVWQGKQTASALKDVIDWRLQVAAPAFSRLESKVDTLDREVERLRNQAEGRS